MNIIEALQNLADQECRYVKRRANGKALGVVRDQHSNAHRLYVYFLENVLLANKDEYYLTFDDFLVDDWECIL